MMYWRTLTVGFHMINWRIVTIGFILAVVLGLLLGTVAGSAVYLSGIIAGIVVGYMVNKFVMNGAIHGALAGAIAGIVLAILIVILALTTREGAGALMAAGGAIAIIGTIIAWAILWGVLGAIGGAIGSAITGRSRQMQPMGGSAIIENETQPTEEMKSKIAFDMENLQKCICDECGVQAKSDCAKTKMVMLQESMKGMSLEPSDVPGLYCAGGIATCNDLDPNKMCNCSNCDLFKENNLAKGEPGDYFCQNGKAM